MSRFARTALSRIETMLTSVRGEGVPLRAELRLARDFEQEDDEIVFLREDGRPHVVRVQVGGAYLAVNSSFYETVDLGDGMTHVQFDGIRNGPMRRSATGPFIADLRAAFAEAPDGFEPVAAPAVGTHPLLANLVSAAREAIDGTGLTLALNPDGPSNDEDDTLAFLDADGERLAVEARTRPGGFVLRDRETGERIGDFGGRAAAAEGFREALAGPARAPGR